MEPLAKYIKDERTGLEYELCGDYYIITGEDEPEREPIGVWGQRHLNYIQKHCKPFYNKMLNEHTLYDYLLQLSGCKSPFRSDHSRARSGCVVARSLKPFRSLIPLQ